MARIAIVGAGPSGCYLAQALLKALPDAEINILDRLPCPYGLVRYGVAPDHQGTKGVIRQFERLFERQGVAFFGGVTLGRDITLEALQAAHNAVVLATGLSDDRRLGIPGEDLPGVIGAGRLTRAWNDHPDAEGDEPPLGRRVVIMGNGNVAIDLLRLLAKDDAEFDGSDLSSARSRAIVAAGVESIEVIGRGSAEQARFDPVMLRELGKLGAARISVIEAHGEGKVVEALQAIDGHAPAGARRSVTFRFGWTPRALLGDTRLEVAQFVASDGSGAELRLECDSFLTAIGFEGGEDLGRPALLTGASEDGALAPGLYAAGWFRRGPRGTIPENRQDAQLVASRIAADLSGLGSVRPGREALARQLPQAVSYAGWQRIDEAERAASPPTRCRQKIPSMSRMLEIARNEAGARPTDTASQKGER